jgi:hydroxymethylpyrimidine kinase / phosphomethylpyrimidine kinase / thiamine-phosphate diphosphorylase
MKDVVSSLHHKTKGQQVRTRYCLASIDPRYIAHRDLSSKEDMYQVGSGSYPTTYTSLSIFTLMKTFTALLFSLLVCGVIPSLSLSTLSGSGTAMSSSTARSSSVDQCSSSSRSGAAVVVRPPVVYTIAGSDSGGGAGIQADLHAMHSFGCHACCAITCLTAQNSMGVMAVHAPPAAFLQTQLEALQSDLPPSAIKIGMLGTKELVLQVAAFIQRIKRNVKEQRGAGNVVWVVLDPVMISTSGSRLMEEDAQQAMVNELFPYIDLLTPNKFEAEALLGSSRKLSSRQDVEQAARDLLNLNSLLPAVLIKGGHTLTNKEETYAQDYFLSRRNENIDHDDYEPRLCDGHVGVWLQSRRYDTVHTHGTGCTLSSAIASALALGQVERQRRQDARRGSISSIQLVDACCLAKAYVSAGIDQGIGLGQGPGPVRHTRFPQSHEHFPSIAVDDDVLLGNNNNNNPPFRRMVAFHHHDHTTNNNNMLEKEDVVPRLGRILPIVDSEEWIERLCTEPWSVGDITDVQLRIKGETDPNRIAEIVKRCQAHCDRAASAGHGGGGVRLWVNDYWEAAIDAGCFGVHIGQEDLYHCIRKGGLDCLRHANMALGISTHSYAELAVALGICPSYISVGPIFATTSKTVKFDPQGLETVQQWRRLIPPDMPLVAIGGIGDVDSATRVKRAGADCVAVIGAITHAPDIAAAVVSLNEAMNA